MIKHVQARFIKALLVTAFALVPLVAQAVEVPTGGKLDSRIRFVKYEPHNVVKILGHYGYSTHIQFAKGEKVINVALGDSSAWDVAPIRNHIFLKPTREGAATNMTVITSRHVYNFYLEAQKATTSQDNDDQFFQVSFRYPDQQAAKAKKLAKLYRQKQKKIDTKRLLDTTVHNPRNWDYVGCGDKAVTPNLVWDDGIFTYMKFDANRRMPAIFVVDGADGSGGESLVNSHVEGGVIVIHRTAKKFVLRRGNLVACVKNLNYNPAGQKAKTNTYNLNIERVIKGDAQ